MQQKKEKNGTFSLVAVTLLTAVLILIFTLLAFYGGYVLKNSQPFTVMGAAVYPNIDENNQPVTYSAVLYRENTMPQKGNAVAFFNEKCTGISKINTAYFFEENGEGGYTLFNANTGEYFDIAKENLKGRATRYIPFMGPVLSFAITVPGTAAFAVCAAAVLFLFILYLLGYIKRAKQLELIREEKKREEEFYAASEEKAYADENEVGRQRIAEVSQEDINEETVNSKTDEQTIKNEELKAQVKADDRRAYFTVTGEKEKLEKLLVVISALNQKQPEEFSVVEEQGEKYTFNCSRDKLAVIAAAINRINETVKKTDGEEKEDGV